MPQKQVLVLDSEAERGAFFSRSLAGENTTVQITEQVEQAIDACGPAGLILIDYQTLVTAEREKVIRFFKQIDRQKIIVHNVPENADRRMAFYELGAGRVFDSSHPQEEVCFSCQRWLSSADLDDKQSIYSGGNLKDLPLSLLIPVLGKERRAGLLKIVAPNNSGKIYFHNGQIDQASVGTHSAEQAVWHILLWREGKFTFYSLDNYKPLRQISLSNPGILIKAAELESAFEEQSATFCRPDAVIRARNAGDLQATDFNIKAGFIQLLQRPKQFKDILENSFYPNYQTLEILLKLQGHGFLDVHQPVEHLIRDIEPVKTPVGSERDSLLTKSQSQQIRANLSREQNTTLKLALLGGDESLIQQFTDLLPYQKESLHRLKKFDIIQSYLADDLDLILFVFKVNQRLIDNLSGLIGDLDGLVFLMDGQSGQKLEYESYVLKQIRQLRALPTTAAITAPGPTDNLDDFREKYDIPRGVSLTTFIPDDLPALRQIFLAIQNNKTAQRVH